MIYKFALRLNARLCCCYEVHFLYAVNCKAALTGRADNLKMVTQKNSRALFSLQKHVFAAGIQKIAERCKKMQYSRDKCLNLCRNYATMI